MTNENGNGSMNAARTIGALVGTGVLGVIAAGMLAVANDARIAISVAEQHGEEILLIRGEMVSMRVELLQRTQARYTSHDAEQHEKYVTRRLDEIDKKLDDLQERVK